MVYVGIDIAKSKHDFFIVREDGEDTIGPITIQNNLEGFTKLHQTIRKVSGGRNDTFIGMESTGHYSDNILHFLHEKGFIVYLMNPKLTSDIRKASSLRRTKTDKIDCRAIANIVRTHRAALEPYTSKSYHIDQLKSLTRYRGRLVADRSRLKISVKRLIHILFPEYDGIISNTHGTASYMLLSIFPGKESIATADIRKLTNILHSYSKGKYGRDMAISLKELAKKSIGAVNPVQSQELKETIKRIHDLTILIDKLDQEISNRAKELKSPILTIPGIGNVLAGIILSEIGNFARFENSDKLVAFAGLSPTTYQSGQYVATNARMEKRGSKQLRHAIMFAAESVARHNPYYACQMVKKRTEGKPYRVAVSHVARNLLRLIYSMELSGKEYRMPKA